MRRIDYAFDTKFELTDPRKYTEWIIQVVREEKQEVAQLMYTFCSDEALLKMNQQFLGHDYYTDILTFPSDNTEGLTGEIFISVDRVQENAEAYGVSMEDELRRVMIHGVLHLLGYNDHDPKAQQVMRAQEDRYVKMFHVKH